MISFHGPAKVGADSSFWPARIGNQEMDTRLLLRLIRRVGGSTIRPWRSTRSPVGLGEGGMLLTRKSRVFVPGTSPLALVRTKGVRAPKKPTELVLPMLVPLTRIST